MAMFPQFGAAPGAPAPGGSASLLSFKAGKMKMEDKGGDKFHITPDLRKGTVSLFKGPDDQLMHFSWKERPSGAVVDDIIILPEEAVYKKVDTGREGDRVYLMEIAGDRRFFYWMQDKSSEQDEENMKKVNELTNSPPADEAPAARGGSLSPDVMDLLGSMGAGAPSASMPGAPGTGASGGGNPSEQGLNIQNLQSILQNMGFSPQEQALASGATPTAGATPATPTTSGSGSGSGSTSTTAPPAAEASGAATAGPTPAAAGNSGGGGSGGGLTAADLQRAMMNIGSMSARAQEQPTSLNDVVDAGAIEASGILDDPDVQEMLVPLLPEGQQTEEELRETLRSPQLQQALSSLSQALQSDNYNSILSSSDLDSSNPRSTEAMARGNFVNAFLQAVMHAAQAKQGEAAEATDKLDAREGENSG